MRFFLTIEYDGSNFVGWQRQNSGPSIQEAVENSIYKIIQIRTSIYGSGRTDAGVHASGQVAHVDIEKEFQPMRLMEAINAYLIDYRIKIINVQTTLPDAHARFSATSREYEYVILNRAAPPAIDEGKVWHQRKILNIEKMQEAGKLLEGTHDFTSYRASQCQSKSPIKTLDNLTVFKENQKIIVRAKAKSFLHHQVRNIVGTLKLVGSEKWRPYEVINALDKKDRTAAGPTAPACGLTLKDIEFPKNIFL
tara:strand:- start:166 stop:918 length:753 start_codon:yes stop_codon:yes gene_type:complete